MSAKAIEVGQHDRDGANQEIRRILVAGVVNRSGVP
jgi:hypothetical protein